MRTDRDRAPPVLPPICHQILCGGTVVATWCGTHLQARGGIVVKSWWLARARSHPDPVPVPDPDLHYVRSQRREPPPAGGGRFLDAQVQRYSVSSTKS